MISRWQWVLRRLTRRLWFRASLLSALGVITALVSAWVAPLIPAEVPGSIGSDAVDDILRILATSMLAVTTFSLSTAVQAYGNATNNVTPRATKLLIEDVTTQNVLATFIGAFLYGLVGIIALSTGLYGSQGRVILFVATLLVILLIVVTLLRWVDHLLELGRVGKNTSRVEEAATKAIRDRVEHPFLGGRPLRDPEREIPATAKAVHSERIGYVQNIDVQALSDLAEKHGGEIFATVLPGTFIDASRPLAWLSGIPPAEETEAAVRDAVSIGEERSFEQDPRYGFSVLTEIASRALSPSMNDPGTAIDVIGRVVRVLSIWGGCDDHDGGNVPCPRVHVPPVELRELFDDAFKPIARDGASLFEVQIRLQKALNALAKIDRRYAREAARHARFALTHAERALSLPEEKAPLAELAHATECVAEERRRS